MNNRYHNLNWRELCALVRAPTPSVNWQALAEALVERAKQELEDAYDAGRGAGHDGYHHWDS